MKTFNILLDDLIDDYKYYGCLVFLKKLGVNVKKSSYY